MIRHQPVNGIKFKPAGRGSICIIVFLTAVISCSSGFKGPDSGVLEKKGAKKAPVYSLPMRGLYVPLKKWSDIGFIKDLVIRGGKYGINMLAVDIHTFELIPKIKSGTVKFIKSRKIYLAARINCFPGGLNSMIIPEGRLKKIYNIMKLAADAGFDEVQLDYIRFHDPANLYTLKEKYKFIEGLFARIKNRGDGIGIGTSAVILGRVVFNRDDKTGQKLEKIAAHTDTVYPVLYPSHFIESVEKMSHPGKTVRNGIETGLKRLRGTGVSLHPYIQSFRYNIQWARTSIVKYIELQVRAVESTGARGWVAWNSSGSYDNLFKALSRIKKDSD